MPRDALAGRAAMRLGLPGNWLSLGAIMLTSTIIGMTLAFSFPLLSLVLDHRGIPADLIGLNSAMNGLAVFVIAPWLPRLVNRLGVARSMALGQSLCIASLLALPLEVDLVLWSALRFLLGLGTVLAWVASESAVNALAEEARRGRVIGVYATLFCVGYAAGPALVGVTGSEGFLPFALCASLLALGLLPLLLVRGLDRLMAEPGRSDLTLVWRQAPVALGAILVFGFVETICFALLPIYGLRVGYDEVGATLLLSALIAGNIIFQLPLGWLADHLPRISVLLGCVAVSLAGVLMWPQAMAGALVWPLLLIWGGALGGLYTLSQTLLGERFRGSDLAVANTAFVLLYQVGAMSGPAIGGIALERLGVPGLPLTMALALAAFLIPLALAGRRRRAPG
ncbi:MAG: MFS transporter [Geminicoccaceae bacterium]